MSVYTYIYTSIYPCICIEIGRPPIVYTMAHMNELQGATGSCKCYNPYPNPSAYEGWEAGVGDNAPSTAMSGLLRPVLLGLWRGYGTARASKIANILFQAPDIAIASYTSNIPQHDFGNCWACIYPLGAKSPNIGRMSIL